MKPRRGTVILIALGLVALVANLLLDYSAGIKLPVVYIARALAVLVSVSIPIFSYGQAEDRYRRSEAERGRHDGVEHLRRVLEASVKRLFPEENTASIRANIMLAEKDELKPLCGWNMEAYPDSRLVLRTGQGVAGKVWKRVHDGSLASNAWRPIYAPRPQLAKNKLKTDWNLNDDQIEATTHILWILSTPVILKKGEAMEFIGVMNFDGVIKRLKKMKALEGEDFHQRCAVVADNVGREIEAKGLLAAPGPTGDIS